MARLFIQMKLELVVKYEEKEIFADGYPLYLASSQYFADGNFYFVSNSGSVPHIA